MFSLDEWLVVLPRRGMGSGAAAEKKILNTFTSGSRVLVRKRETRDFKEEGLFSGTGASASTSPAASAEALEQHGKIRLHTLRVPLQNFLTPLMTPRPTNKRM